MNDPTQQPPSNPVPLSEWQRAMSLLRNASANLRYAASITPAGARPWTEAADGIDAFLSIADVAKVRLCQHNVPYTERCWDCGRSADGDNDVS